MDHPSPPSPQIAARSAFVWRLATSILVFNLLLIAFAAVTLYRDRQTCETDAQIDTKNVCEVLDQSLSGTFREVDLGLLAVKNEYERQLANGGTDEVSLNAFIARESGYLPQLEGLRVVDVTGAVRYGIRVNPLGHATVADRDYFIRLRDDRSAELVFAKPLLEGISKAWSVIAARRLDTQDGNFAGVVYATIPLDTIIARFAALDLGMHSDISLRSERLELMARHPALGKPDEPQWSTRAPQEFARFISSGQKESTIFSPLGDDGIARVVSHSKLDQYPLYLSVGISRHEYLRGWWSDVGKVALLVMLSMLATTFSGLTVYRTRQREHGAMLQLAKQQEKYRIVADNTQDWEFWLGADGTCIYCSPSCFERTGYPVDEFYRDPDLFRRIVHPDDQAAYERHQHAMFHGSGSSTVMSYRIVRADGATRWIEHTCRSVADASGQFLGIRGNNRDITERRRAEQERRYLFDIIERSLNEIYIFDPKTLKFRHVNHGALNNLGYTLEEMMTMAAFEIKPEFTEDSFRQLVQPLLDGQRHVIVFETVHKRADASIYPVEVHLRLVDTGIERVFLAILFDVTVRKQAEAAREVALARVRTLEGIIPICMYCKKIRDSKNTWSQLEKYISEHSEAQFSHGICPSCLQAHRADFE